MSKYDLKIGDVSVRLVSGPLQVGQASAPVASLQSLRVFYGEPRELTFSYTGPNPNRLTVELRVDGVLRFKGKALARRFQPGIDLYTISAYGPEELLDNFDLIDALTWYPDFTVPAQSTLDYIVRKIAQGFEVASQFNPELAELGLTAQFVGGSGDTLPTFHARATTIGGALQMLTNCVPGFAWLIAPETMTLNITLLFSSPTLTLTVGLDQIDPAETEVTESLRGRYTAVRMIGSKVEADWFADASTKLLSAWDPLLEKDFTYDQSGQAASTSSRGDENHTRVFRRFKFDPALSDVIIRDQQILLLQEFQNPDLSLSWASVEVGAIDFANGYIWAKLPAVDPVPARQGNAPNPRNPGKCKKPRAMYMAYRYRPGDGPIPGLRAPETGYSGSAFTAFGIKREKIIYESNDQITNDRITRILSSRQDVLYEGRISLWGDVPDGIWNLNTRINLAVAGKPGGLENAQMILRGFEHRFDRNQTKLEIGTDKTAYLGEVSA